MAGNIAPIQITSISIPTVVMVLPDELPVLSGCIPDPGLSCDIAPDKLCPGKKQEQYKGITDG